MALESLVMKMEMFMKASGKMVKWKGMAFLDTVMEIGMKDSGGMAR